jgi:hypothetical protein
MLMGWGVTPLLRYKRGGGRGYHPPYSIFSGSATTARANGLYGTPPPS